MLIEWVYQRMTKHDCMPDVVCYTVMLTGYIVAGELETAPAVFDEMIPNGQLPNVFIYNAIIRGICMARKFEEVCSVLNSRLWNPEAPIQILPCTTSISYLRNVEKLAEAHKVITHRMKKRQYVHLLSKFKGYKTLN
ncbi:pentatricopeptide repeat-containing protein [Pyrus ussuriensis x Pyrus communis]|uniref:Pentatricopeptide repeat-containing protein n=1 Tax=Pyrus ussuriensis x Pyrus communis TaxID=2448454 RepID=A0A5N5F611_9ROSA|nr:pentatricopeptide repeat-containing protein [Pyrus ussuriensis x Pyrus communis]